MNGWLTFLERPLLHPVPRSPTATTCTSSVTRRGPTYACTWSNSWGSGRGSAISLTAATSVPTHPPFQTHLHRRRLEAALPLPDFFGWCEEELSRVGEERREYHLLKLISLLFGDQSRYQLRYGEHRRTVSVGGSRYTVPTISVSK